MGRKIILRLLLVFSLLAALALGGCGTAPESSETIQKRDQQETTAMESGKAGGENDETVSSGPIANKQNDGEKTDQAVSSGPSTVDANSQTAPASSPGTSGAASSGSGTSAASGGGNAAGKGNDTAKSTEGSVKPESGKTAAAGSAAPKSTTAPKESTATSGSTASTSGTGSTGTSGTSKPAVKPAQKPAPAASASISINGPKDAGVILAAANVEIKDGDTVLDVLLKAAGKKGIDVDYSGSGPTAYVAGIDNYYEFDYGSRSGWICKKNGKTLEKGAGVVKVSNGDRIEWVYSEDFLKKE